jgi:hypothetical protein
MAGQFSRFNAIDQLLDVAGSPRQEPDRLLTDETSGLGSPVILNSGATATITAFGTPNLTVGGLTGQSAASVGSLISIRNAEKAGNNGVFRVNANSSATVNILTNASGFFPDGNSGSLKWDQYNAGIAASITTVVSGIVTITGVQLMTANSVGGFITITGAATAANNGTFLITEFVSATSVKYANAAGVATDANNPNIFWIERLAYSLNDDLDFERSDRTYIKGVNYDAPLPTYTRPTLTTAAVPAHLANLAGKTLDAFAKSVNRGQFNWPVEQTLTDIYGAGTLKHADSVDTTGLPVFDAAPFTSDWNTCFVEVTDSTTGNELEVLGGGQQGQRIFGVAYNGTSTSPNSVEFRWYSCANGGNIATSSTAYVWEQGTATAKTGTTTVTVTAGANGASAITGLTAGGFVSPADVGTWLTFTGLANGANNGTFVIISVQSATAVTVQNHAAITEGPTAAVTWTQFTKTQPTFVNLTYGFNQRLDQLDQNAFRFPLVSGLVGDADLRQDIIDLQSTGGWADGTTNLSTYLTNTGANFVFFTLPGGAGDTVVAALNALNQQIGIRTYTGGILTNGQTITASLQALSNAITASSVVRYIERLVADIPANTIHTLPGGATYILDGTFNALHLWVFWRGLLRDPGSVANGDDYTESSTTQITAFSKIKAGDHISYFVR